MSVRRVVTGHDDTGKAVVVSDEDVQPTDPDFGPKWSIWAADAPVVLPDGGARPAFAGPRRVRGHGLRHHRRRAQGRPDPQAIDQAVRGAVVRYRCSTRLRVERRASGRLA
jgi:hypothetical protein